PRDPPSVPTRRSSDLRGPPPPDPANLRHLSGRVCRRPQRVYPAGAAYPGHRLDGDQTDQTLTLTDQPRPRGRTLQTADTQRAKADRKSTRLNSSHVKI